MKLNKQILLSVGAITGMCCAIGTAIYATPKAKELADKYKDDKVEAAKRVAPLYIPTLLSFIAAGGCIFAKDYISRKELLALTASTTATTSYLVANRDKLKAALQNNKKANDLVKRFIGSDEFRHQTIETTGKGDLLVIEGYSGRIFRSSIEAVEEAEQKLNQMYSDDKYCCMNNFYEFLGIETSQLGHQYGWVNDPEYYDAELKFDNTYIKKEELANTKSNWPNEDILCIEISQYSFPMECWQEI